MIHVACTADERYSPYAAAMLHSLFVACPGRVSAHFLHPPALSPLTRQRLQQLAADAGARITLHEIPEDAVAGLPEMPGIPRLMWFRVLLPELLPELDRILYLDADTLVLEPVDELWSTDLEGLLAAAVANVIEPGLRHRPRELGLPEGQPYFNSGVLLLNLAQMRAAGASRQIIDYARREAAQLRWPDQDALNVVLGPRCRFVHPRWNCQNTLFYWPAAAEIFGADAVREATARPAILHFEGPQHAKPWHYLNSHPYRERYRAELRATPFPVPPLEGRSLGNMLRAHLPRALLRRLRLRLRGRPALAEPRT